MKQSLSPKELAEAVGVSESSLKRWADVGKVRVSRTLGGHRRIALQEAVRFIRDSQLSLVRPEVLGLIGVESQTPTPLPLTEVIPRFQQALLEGLADEARAMMLDQFLRGCSVAELCDGPLRLAIQHIGDLYHHDSRGIFIEHRATEICSHLLTQLRLLLMPPTPVRPPMLPTSKAMAENGSTADDPRPGAVPDGISVAIGGGPAGDHATLGTLMAACVVAEAGYREVNLGGNLPLSALLDAAEEHQPRLVWLACSHTASVPPPAALDRLGQQLQELGAKLVIGGQANPRPTMLAGNVHVCSSMAELSAFAAGVRTALS